MPDKEAVSVVPSAEAVAASHALDDLPGYVCVLCEGDIAKVAEVIQEHVVAPLMARIEELGQDLTAERLARASTTKAVVYEYERAQTAEQRLSEVEAELEEARHNLRGTRP